MSDWNIAAQSKNKQDNEALSFTYEYACAPENRYKY